MTFVLKSIINSYFARDKTKRPKTLDESERGGEKVGLKFNIQKTKIMASDLITSWQINGETMETVTDSIFLGSKNHCRW